MQHLSRSWSCRRSRRKVVVDGGAGDKENFSAAASSLPTTSCAVAERRWTPALHAQTAAGRSSESPRHCSGDRQHQDQRRNHGSNVSSVCENFAENDFRRLVSLPQGVDRQEWLATHSLALFQHINALYGAVAEICTVDSCSVMTGTGKMQFPWVDERGKKWKYSAPQFIDCVMCFVAKTVFSEENFPTKFGNTFPNNFDSVVMKICRTLYQVLAHVVGSHWEHMYALNLHRQTASVCWHFVSFVSEFKLLDAQYVDELISYIASLRLSSETDNSIAFVESCERKESTASASCRSSAAAVDTVRLHDANSFSKLSSATGGNYG